MRKNQFVVIIICIATLLLVTCMYIFSGKTSVPSQENQNNAVLSSLPDSSGSSHDVNLESENSSITFDEANGASTISKSPDTLIDSDADRLLSTFGSIGEDYKLHARQYQQGEVQEEDTPSLGWDGDMTLLVKSASVIPYEETSEYEENDPRGIWPMYAENFQDPCILRLEMSLENQDAHNRTGVQYQFSTSLFYLSGYEDLIPENLQRDNYASVTLRYTALESYFDKNTGTKDYWSFELQPGEAMDFVLEFLVDREYFEQQSPFLAVSLSRKIKAGILLDDIVED